MSSVLTACVSVLGSCLLVSSVLMVCVYVLGSCLLVSSVLMMGLNMKRCYYRPSVSDWTDSETESSISSVGKTGDAASDRDQLIV